MAGREPRFDTESVLLALGCVVMGTWVLLVLIQGAFPSHVVPTEVHGICGIVATSLFGGAWFKARKGDKDA